MILWNDLGVKLQYELYFLLGGLLIVSALYSSVGHGGASGYLALLSLSSYGVMSSVWLKQHVWVMNVVVASIAFFHYNRSGHHKIKLTIPFILASIPMALIGGMLAIDGNLYDLLLSITLVWASYKVINFSSQKISNNPLPSTVEPYLWGGGIGLFSGMFLITISIGAYVGSYFGAKNASNSLVRKLLAVVLIVAATKRIIELF